MIFLKINDLLLSPQEKNKIERGDKNRYLSQIDRLSRFEKILDKRGWWIPLRFSRALRSPFPPRCVRSRVHRRNKSIAVCKCWSHNGPRGGLRNRLAAGTVIFPRVRRLSDRRAREHRFNRCRSTARHYTRRIASLRRGQAMRPGHLCAHRCSQSTYLKAIRGERRGREKGEARRPW